MAAKKQILPAQVDVTVNGETITIKQFPFGKYHIVMGKLMPLLSVFQPKEGDEVPLALLLEAGGENVMDVIALAAGKSRDWLDTIYDYDEMKALATAVFEVNKDLFVKKVLPDLTKMLAKLAPATKAAA